MVLRPNVYITHITISVIVTSWSGEYYTFVVETYLKNYDSIFTTHFRLRRNDTFLDRKTITKWAIIFSGTGSVLKIKQTSRPRCIHTHHNIQIVKNSVIESTFTFQEYYDSKNV